MEASIRNTILGISIAVITLLAGCSVTPKDASIEKIYEKQQENISKKQPSEGLSKRITENMKKNSMASMESARKAAEAVQNKQGDEREVKSFEGMAEDAAVKFNSTIWGGVFFFLVSLQGASIPIALVLMFLGGGLAYFFRKAPKRQKGFIIMAISGPVIFLIINYVPAFLWYLQE